MLKIKPPIVTIALLSPCDREENVVIRKCVAELITFFPLTTGSCSPPHSHVGHHETATGPLGQHAVQKYHPPTPSPASPVLLWCYSSLLISVKNCVCLLSYA